MTALQILDSSILIETLKDIPEILTLTSWNGIHKIFWEHVQQDIPLPYITLHHIMGGEDNETQTRASDTVWKVQATTGDMLTAKNFANAISKLQNKYPVIPSAYNSIAAGYTSIEENTPIFDRGTMQNIPVFYVGGLYRLRLSITE